MNSNICVTRNSVYPAHYTPTTTTLSPSPSPSGPLPPLHLCCPPPSAPSLSANPTLSSSSRRRLASLSAVCSWCLVYSMFSREIFRSCTSLVSEMFSCGRDSARQNSGRGVNWRDIREVYLPPLQWKYSGNDQSTNCDRV